MEDLEVQKKQLEYVIQQIMISATFGLVTVWLLSASLFAMRDDNQTQIIIWAIISSIITVARYAILRHINNNFSAENLTSIKKYILATAFLGASIWAICGYTMVSISNPIETAIIVTTIVAISCSAVPIMSPYYASLIIFSGVSILPISLALITNGDSTLSILTLLALAFICVSGLRLKNQIIQSINIDFANKKLLDKLTIEKDRADKAKEKADQANKSKSLFLAAASHDLRQPLQSMGIFLDTLESKLQEPEYQNIISHINNSHHALTKLFDSLLEISRLDSGSMRHSIIDCQLLDTINPIIIEFDHDLTKKDLELKTTLTPTAIKTDPILLGRIIRNLLSNAIKFTEFGHISITNYQQNDKIYLSIKDTGIGISEAKQEHVFDEYYQISNASRDRSKGVGLGLSVVKKLCKLLNHNINLTSKPNNGSEFIIEFSQGNAQAIIPQQSQPETDIASSQLAGANILVVDNEPDIVKAMEVLLTDWQANMLGALSLNEALENIQNKQFTPDVIISDYRLDANTDGLDVISSIRKHFNKEIPALLISGDTNPEIRKSIKQKGFFILQKPTKAGQLKRVITSLLSP